MNFLNRLGCSNSLSLRTTHTRAHGITGENKSKKAITSGLICLVKYHFVSIVFCKKESFAEDRFHPNKFEQPNFLPERRSLHKVPSCRHSVHLLLMETALVMSSYETVITRRIQGVGSFSWKIFSTALRKIFSILKEICLLIVKVSDENKSMRLVIVNNIQSQHFSLFPDSERDRWFFEVFGDSE